jgi:hypothetical protein
VWPVVTAKQSSRPLEQAVGDVTRRVMVAAVVIAALTGVSVAARLTSDVGRRTLAPVAAYVSPAAGASAVSPENVSSTAWYCAAGAAPTIVLSSASTSVVHGTVTWAGRVGSSFVSVTPGGQSDVASPRGVAGPQAATVLLFRGGVAVSETVRDANGWSVAPCASSASTSWYFPQGSTLAGDSVTLDLYDPSVTAAVVDIDVLTHSGEAQPAAYQGLAVPAGGLVTEKLDTHATGDPVLGTIVEAASGSVVADELDLTSTGARHGTSLELGAPATQRLWAFPYTVLPKGGSVSVNIMNPDSTDSDLVLNATYRSGTPVRPVTVSLKSQSVSTVDLGDEPGFAAMTPYSIVISSSSPVVVGRAVYAPARSARPNAGYTLGVTVGARRWLVPGAGPHGHATSFAIEALGSKPVHVTVKRAASSSAAVAGGRDSAVVFPGVEVHIEPRSLSSYSGPLLVVADGPVAVELDAGPSGSPGIVMVPAFVLPSF